MSLKELGSWVFQERIENVLVISSEREKRKEFILMHASTNYVSIMNKIVDNYEKSESSIN